MWFRHPGRRFFTDFVTGSDHRLTYHKNGGAAATSQFWGGGCIANQTLTRAGTISRALRVRNYNNRAAVYVCVLAMFTTSGRWADGPGATAPRTAMPLAPDAPGAKCDTLSACCGMIGRPTSG